MLRSLRNTALAAALLIGLTGVARAEEPWIPETAAEHRAMAKAYQDKAAASRAEAAFHRQMAADYRKAHPDLKSGARNPWTVEMEQHCRAIVADAQARAADATDRARFHAFRAEELEGK